MDLKEFEKKLEEEKKINNELKILIDNLNNDVEKEKIRNSTLTKQLNDLRKELTTSKKVNKEGKIKIKDLF